MVKDAVKAASKPNIWFDESSLPPVSTVRQTGTGTLRVAPISAARREACRSGWPGWRYAAPARVPGIRGGRARAWRVGQMARMLKRPWSRHWRRIYQECHKVWHTWQDGVPQAPETYWWLANAYRLVYPRAQWKRIQGHLLSLAAFPSCSRTCDLVRAHRRSDTRVESGDLSREHANYVLTVISADSCWGSCLTCLQRCLSLCPLCCRGNRSPTGRKALAVSKGSSISPFVRWVPVSCVALLGTARQSRSGQRWQAALAPASIGPTFCCPSDTSSVLRAGRACGFAMQTSRLSRGVLPLWRPLAIPALCVVKPLPKWDVVLVASLALLGPWSTCVASIILGVHFSGLQVCGKHQARISGTCYIWPLVLDHARIRVRSVNFCLVRTAGRVSGAIPCIL